MQSIDQAKAGLQATLIVRHPDDGKLYVNFDQEILQLIRESKCLGKRGFILVSVFDTVFISIVLH